jgi:hypothetical protein
MFFSAVTLAGTFGGSKFSNSHFTFDIKLNISFGVLDIWNERNAGARGVAMALYN